MSAYESRGGHLFGNQLADIAALLKFQKNLVEGSEQAAKFIIPFHYADALRALDAFRLIKNTTLQLEVTQLKAAWEQLKRQAESQERDSILEKFSSKVSKNLQDRVAATAAATTGPQRATGLANSMKARATSAGSQERTRTLAQAQAITKLSERRDERREQARSARREKTKSASQRSRSSGRAGSAKVLARRVNAGGQAMLSKSSKEIEAKLLRDEPDLTRALRPSFSNALKKGEGVGGGARPAKRERSIGVEALTATGKSDAAPAYNRDAVLESLNDTLGKQQTRITHDLADIENENKRARSHSRGNSLGARNVPYEVVPPAPREPVQFAFGQRVQTAAKQPPNRPTHAPEPEPQPQVSQSQQRRPRSRGRDEPHSVHFEPSSILKKESTFGGPSSTQDGAANDLVAVSDPAQF